VFVFQDDLEGITLLTSQTHNGKNVLLRTS